MPQRVCRNRVLSLQSFFRRSSRYAFWQLDMFIKRTLFFKNLHSGGYRPKVTDGDKFAQTFGTIIPSSIPESSAWWKMQARELAAICDDGESGSRLSRVVLLVVSSCSLMVQSARAASRVPLSVAGIMHSRVNSTHAQCAVYDIRSLSGIMHSMVTAPSSPYGSLSVGLHICEAYLITGDCQITHNNRSPEMLAVVRRGPFARPTPEEKIEHLLTRVRKSGSSVAFADHALEHTLSFQRRVHSIKVDFLKRCAKTPLGITHDYWDRWLIVVILYEYVVCLKGAALPALPL